MRINKKCGNCKWAFRWPVESIVAVDCRRYPPKKISSGSCWPTVVSNGWCGEWEFEENPAYRSCDDTGKEYEFCGDCEYHDFVELVSGKKVDLCSHLKKEIKRSNIDHESGERHDLRLPLCGGPYNCS